MIYRKYLKRIFDFVGAFILLIILSPLLVIIGLIVKLKIGSPVIFAQDRPGLNEEIFKLYKFRSMREAKDSEGRNLSDSDRLTKFGRALRASSLDELPELVNILKGQMSFVGPRPLLIEYLPLYNERHRRRHEVRPGLTGLAQVSGRNAIGWEEKFDLDIDYIETMSLVKDLGIILKTAGKVIARHGISDEQTETMTKFEGY